jgi:hypothetical protein
VARLGPRTRAFLGLNTRALGDSVNELIPSRPWQSNPGSVQVTAEVASRHSGVWAAQRLRANLISSMPIYIDKRSYTTGVMQRMPLPPVMVNPYGPDDPNGTDRRSAAVRPVHREPGTVRRVRRMGVDPGDGDRRHRPVPRRNEVGNH